jgi:hypothetical protein
VARSGHPEQEDNIMATTSFSDYLIITAIIEERRRQAERDRRAQATRPRFSRVRRPAGRW